MSLLEVKGLIAGYGAHDEVLKGVGLEVGSGEVVAVLGPNGAGKSTLLKAVAGLVRPRRGDVLVEGRSIAGLAPREVSRRRVVFVPQEANIFPSLTIEENLEIASWLERRRLKMRLEAVYTHLPELARRRRLRGGALSGGQRQTLAMGMALMVEPLLMLLDEPTAGLSPAAAQGLFALVAGIRKAGVAIAMVEQNASAALAIADRAYILVDGANARSGQAAALAQDPDIRRIFLGDDRDAA